MVPVTRSFTSKGNLESPVHLLGWRWEMGGNQTTGENPQRKRKSFQTCTDSNPSSGSNQEPWSCEAARIPGVLPWGEMSLIGTLLIVTKQQRTSRVHVLKGARSWILSVCLRKLRHTRRKSGILWLLSTRTNKLLTSPSEDSRVSSFLQDALNSPTPAFTSTPFGASNVRVRVGDSNLRQEQKHSWIFLYAPCCMPHSQVTGIITFWNSVRGNFMNADPWGQKVLWEKVL